MAEIPPCLNRAFKTPATAGPSGGGSSFRRGTTYNKAIVSRLGESVGGDRPKLEDN